MSSTHNNKHSRDCRRRACALPGAITAYQLAVQRTRRSAFIWATLAVAALTIPAAISIGWAEARFNVLLASAGGPLAMLSIVSVTLPAMSAFSCLALFSARRCIEDRKLAAAYEHKALLCKALPEVSRARVDAGISKGEIDIEVLLNALAASGVGYLRSGKDEALPLFDAISGFREVLAGIVSSANHDHPLSGDDGRTKGAKSTRKTTT